MNSNLNDKIDNFFNVGFWLSNNLEKLFEYSEDLKDYSIEDYKSWDFFEDGISIEYINKDTNDEEIAFIGKEKIYKAMEKDLLKENVENF